MNDEPCMCGTAFTCLADVHLVTTERAATILGVTPRAVRQAVTRGRLHAAGRDEHGYVFDVADLQRYTETRGRSAVAERDRQLVPSNRR